MKLMFLVAPLVKKAQRAIVMRQLAAVDNRQREVVSDMLFAMDVRIHAQAEFAEQSTANAAHKRRLLAKLDLIDGISPPQANDGLAVQELPLIAVEPQEVPAPFPASPSATEAELRRAADLATCCHAALETDPLNWPLPCDIEIGGSTIPKGITLRTLAERMKVLHAMAMQAFPKAATMAVDPASAAAELNKTLV